jgi:hypothetical protein
MAMATTVGENTQQVEAKRKPSQWDDERGQYQQKKRSILDRATVVIKL